MTTATKIGFANAVRKYGDGWVWQFYRPRKEESHAAKTLHLAITKNSLIDATSDVQDFCRMGLCERYGRSWQKGAGL